MTRFSFSSFRFLFSFCFLSFSFSLSPFALQAQSLLIEQAKSTVTVRQNNLAQAKKEALQKAKNQAVRQALARFLDAESRTLLEPLLLLQFLERSDAFIESIRVIDEGGTADLSEFFLTLEARIFRSRLLAAFRKSGLPLQSEQRPLREVALIYDADPPLNKSGVSKQFLRQLQMRLNPYRIRLKQIPLPKKKISPASDVPEKNISSLPKLKLRLINTLPDSSPEGRLKAELFFRSQNTELPNSSRNTVQVTAEQAYSVWNPEEIIPRILDNLITRWTPVIQKILTVNSEGEAQVKLKFKGLPGPREERQLFKILFQNNLRWKNFRLDVIARDFVVYRALFLGKRAKILQEFRPPLSAPFRVISVKREDSYLAVQVEWNEVPALLEPFLTTLSGTGISAAEASGGADSAEKNIPEPTLQVPLRPFKQTYNLPLATVVYDHIRHRGDSTLFRVDIPQKITAATAVETHGRASLQISWYRFSPTNLQPLLTLYDQDRKRIKSYRLQRRKQALQRYSFQYQIPKGQTAFYLRVSDEIGYLEGAAGSYQSFRYILLVTRGG